MEIGRSSGTRSVPSRSQRGVARQAKILCDEAEENNLRYENFRRWDTCSLCEHRYHGMVLCALGWAAWKTYVGRPEANWADPTRASRGRRGRSPRARRRRRAGAAGPRGATRRRASSIQQTATPRRWRRYPCSAPRRGARGGPGFAFPLCEGKRRLSSRSAPTAGRLRRRRRARPPR